MVKSVFITKVNLAISFLKFHKKIWHNNKTNEMCS